MTFDSKTTYELWKRLIFDETLCQAVLAGDHREHLAARGLELGEKELAVLDWFHRYPGTRWNIENLRYRSALETAAILSIYLPRTVTMLTRGDEDWLQDIAFEYLSHHRWDALGHFRLGECERFAAYVRERIAKRRRLPEHLEPVLELELAAISVLKETAAVPAEAWLASPRLASRDQVAACRPRRGPVHRLLEQAVDLRAWMKADPKQLVSAAIPVGPGPVTWLIYVPSLELGHRMKVISEGVRELLERCTGAPTGAEVAATLEEEFDLPRDDVLRLIGSLVDEGVLAAG